MKKTKFLLTIGVVLVMIACSLLWLGSRSWPEAESAQNQGELIEFYRKAQESALFHALHEIGIGALSADFFVGGGGDVGHLTGYNVAYSDGSASYYSDKEPRGQKPHHPN